MKRLLVFTNLRKKFLFFFFLIRFIIKSSGYCIVVVPLPSKQEVRVRFPLSAPKNFVMADVAKWLRQWIVTPLFAGSTPVIRLLISYIEKVFYCVFFVYLEMPLIGFEPIRQKSELFENSVFTYFTIAAENYNKIIKTFIFFQ